MIVAQHALVESETVVETLAETQRAPIADKLLGLLLMTVAPAMFWTGCLAGAGWALGTPVRSVTLASVAVIITAFLGVICAALSNRGTE